MALTDGLIAAWNFNSNGIDASGNGHTTTPSGAIYDSVNQKLGSACLSTDGIDDNTVAVDSDDFTLSGGGTIAIWVKPDSTGSGASSFIQKYDTGKREFAIRSNIDTTVLEFNLYDESANGVIQRTWNTANIFDDAWHLIIADYDGGTVATGVNMYIDTVAQGATNTTGTFTSIENLTADLEIGGSTILGYWKGLTDTTAIWNRVLTSGERAELWNGGAGIEVSVDAVGFPFFFDAGHY